MSVSESILSSNSSREKTLHRKEKPSEQEKLPQEYVDECIRNLLAETIN